MKNKGFRSMNVRHNGRNRLILSGLALFVLFVVCCGGFNLLYINTEAHVTAKVTHKERVAFGSSDSLQSKYLVYTDVETFEITDALLYGRFNSADTYGNLKVGETYNLKVVGWRIPLFSQYRNIISVGTWTE